MMRRRSAPLARLAANGMLHNPATRPKKTPARDRVAGRPMTMTISNIAENVRRNTRRRTRVPSRQAGPNRRIWNCRIQKSRLMIAVSKKSHPAVHIGDVVEAQRAVYSPDQLHQFKSNSGDRDRKNEQQNPAEFGLLAASKRRRETQQQLVTGKKHCAAWSAAPS